MAKEGTLKYGEFYWCIKTGKLSQDGEIFVMADEVQVLPDGTLMFLNKRPRRPALVNLTIASGHWTACYAASMIDGSPVAVERWAGELKR